MLSAGATAVTAVIGGNAGFGAALAAALGRRPSAAVVALESVDDLSQATMALQKIDDLSAVVHVCGDDTASDSGVIASTEPASWTTDCERALWRALISLQAAYATLSRRNGGHIVVITATAGLSGAAHMVPLVAAMEGTRAMAKSAARQWGASGISVNCVAVPLGLLSPNHASLTSFLPPAAIERDDPLDDVSHAVAFLTGPSADGISGATLLVDGGAVMAP